MAEVEHSREKQRHRHREWMREWRAKNREKYNTRMRDWRAANRERARALAAEGHARWVAANPEKAKEVARGATKKWRAKNPASVAPRHTYALHKSGAKYRGIAFLFTFEEWMTIWVDSGKWEERGGGLEQFCMARHNDVGAYAVGNVKICTNRENFAENHENRKGKKLSQKTRERISIAAKARGARRHALRHSESGL
jgi:hypothetical protein